jgi:hypothetical protein
VRQHALVRGAVDERIDGGPDLMRSGHIPD